MNYTNDALQKADMVREGAPKLTDFEALQIAVQIQRNELFAQAHVLNTRQGGPSALESIAIELGAAHDGRSIKHAVEEIARNIERFS